MKWLCVLFVLMPTCRSTNEFSEPQNITSGPCTDSKHLFLAPGVLTAGGTNRACVSRFDPEGPARMLLTLIAEDIPIATTSRELPPGDGGCVDIAVPHKPNTKAKLVVNLRYPEAKCSWERELSVLISAGRVVVVHTERARYRAGETLRARIIALKPDLTPAHGLIDEAWVEGPSGAWEGSRAVQWLRVRTRMGIAQVQHELDELAPAGRWTIRARLADGSQGSAVFWVGSYELPPFQLSVRHAPRVLRTSERLVWTVCVRYPWTEAVEGMLVIRIRGAGGTTVASEPQSIKTVVRIKAPRACHRHAAAARRIGLNGTNPPDVVVADFSFQEDGTRIWQNTTVVSQVVDQPVTLEFLRKVRAVISPGLPYKLKVKATRWDDKPAANEHIRVCRAPAEFAQILPLNNNASDSCNDAVTDDRGIARVTFTSADDGSSYYTFQASLRNASQVQATPLRLPARYSGLVHASLGPVKLSTPSSARTFVPLYINLKNVSKPLTVHFVVITRGGIIYRWGATTQCPLTSSSDYIPTTSRNSQCYYDRDNNVANYQTNSAKYQPNTEKYQSNTANSEEKAAKVEKTAANNETNDPYLLLDRHLLRVMLPIKVTHQMCPDSHLVAYFYYNGELVSASKQFEMDECFSNKVEAIWHSRQVGPGSLASLRVSTPGPALCALSVLDSASKWSQPAPTLKELVMSELKRLVDSHRNLTQYEAAGTCFNTSDAPELPSNSRELTAMWLAAAGVRVTGGYVTSSQRCSPPALLMDEVTVPRSDFSEAWLWRLAAVGANGSTVVSARAPDSISRFEATAVCLARTGIAVSPPAVLQVFREFFIHADGPRRLRRGDATIIRYRLFNYLYEPLSVQIQILTDAHLEGPADVVETACIPARSSVSRRVEMRARVCGSARLSVRAKSVRTDSCGNHTQTHTSVSDEVIISIAVDPEGVPIQEHKSILLCGKGSVESSMSEVSWSWPSANAVPGTEALTVWAMGDVKGPLLFDSDALVTLPRGCGEQNMARLAANLLAYQQGDPASAAAATAKEHVARGFTRQLQYVHPTGGFSAFGAADPTPSTWLTAFALKYMRRAHQVLNPELPVPPALERAERWLLSQQMENGCFRNEGQVFHRELRGGLNEDGEVASVALAAYVITALVDSSTTLPARVLRNAVACLRALPPGNRSSTGVYAHALLGYAFMRLRSYEDELRKTNEASLLWEKKDAIGAGLKEDEELRELVELLKIARRSGDYVWWETSSLATSVEATAYALLALSHCPAQIRSSSCAADARAAVRWLSAHRNHAGGFLSTQDTLVALEALSSWSAVQPSVPPNLVVRVHSGGETKKIHIQPDIKIPDVTRIAGKSQVDVKVEGTGCALVQATRSYNTLSPEQRQDKLLTVQATVHTDGTFDCDVNGTNCFCAAVIEVCVSWSGAFPAMAVAELTLPPAYGADATRLYALLTPDSLIRRIELTPNGGRATLYLSSRDGMESGRAGHRCFPVPCVGPRARTKPAHLRLIDYYTPTINDTQMYTIPEDCPPRISHPANDWTPSDNLFVKAKSLNDSEILITHEFSFDDIPEGIPLEDSLYDLNREDIAYLTENNEIQHAQNSPVGKTEENMKADKNSTDNSLEDRSSKLIKQPTKHSRLLTNVRSASNEQNRNNDIKKVYRASRRQGHSFPFVTAIFPTELNIGQSNHYGGNFYTRNTGQNIFSFGHNNYQSRNSPNFGVNYYSSDYITPNIDPRFLYPEPTVPFENNYFRRNFNPTNYRSFDYSDGNFRQSTDQSHVYPEMYYYTNIFPQKIDAQSLSMKHYKETLARLYSKTDFKTRPQATEKAYPENNDNVQNYNGSYTNQISDKNVPIIIPIGDTKHEEVITETNYDIPKKQHSPRTTTSRYPSLTTVKNVYNYLDSYETYIDEPAVTESKTSDQFENTTIPSSTPVSSSNFEITRLENANNNAELINVENSSPAPISFNTYKENPVLFDIDKAGLDFQTYSESETTSPNLSKPSLNPNLSNPVPSQPNKQLLVTSTHQNDQGSKLDPNLSNANFTNHNIPDKDSESFSQLPHNSVLSNVTQNSLSDPSTSNFDPNLSDFPREPEKTQTRDPEILNPSSQLAGVGSNYGPTINSNPNPSNIHLSAIPSNPSQPAGGVLDNPNLSNFHVIDSETDLEVPSGMEGPVPAVALPPPNFVAVAPPPGFIPLYSQGGYPRQYQLPPRPQYYYRQLVPAG